MLLPGEPGSASDWSGDGNADNTADAFAQAHHGLAPIIVMPDPDGYLTTDSECVNSRFGNAETYLVDDVPAFVRAEYHASEAPGSLAIGGLSAGGTCSVMLALRHPQVYPTFASYSGFASPQYQDTTRAETIDTLFGGSEDSFAAHDPAQILRTGQFDGLAGWFEVGDQDAGPLDGRPTPAAGRPQGRDRHLHPGPARRPRLRPVEPGAGGLVPLAVVAARSHPEPARDPATCEIAVSGAPSLVGPRCAGPARWSPMAGEPLGPADRPREGRWRP